jgi:hypothetical protein
MGSTVLGGLEDIRFWGQEKERYAKKDLCGGTEKFLAEKSKSRAYGLPSRDTAVLLCPFKAVVMG